MGQPAQTQQQQQTVPEPYAWNRDRVAAFLSKRPERTKEKPLASLQPQAPFFELAMVGERILHVKVITAPGVHPLELLASDFWAHVARQLPEGTHIEAWAEDRVWYAEYLVLEKGDSWARVHLRENTVELFDRFEQADDAAMYNDYEVTHAGLVAQWRVVRKRDRVTLRDGFKQKGQAIAWLEGHVRSLRR